MSDRRREMDAAIAGYARANALPSMGHNARVDEALEHAATVEAVDWTDVLWKLRAAPISPKLDATELMWFPPKDGAAFVEKIDSLIARSDIGSLAERLFKSAKRDAERLTASSRI